MLTYSQLKLERFVGIAIAATALVAATINFLNAPSELEGQVVRIILAPQVSTLILYGVLAAVSVIVPRLRWVQVVLLIIVGLLSLTLATEGNLTGFVWLLVGLLLGWEYGYFRRRTRLFVGSIVVTFVVIWSLDLIVLSGANFADLLVTLLGGSLLGAFGWVLIILKQRELETRAAELEQAVSERTAQLADALSEQKLLLAELHHRTKNNLQLVSTMLFFDEEDLASPDPARARSAQTRIQALGRVHEILFARTGSGQVRVADFVSDYLEQAVLMVESNGLTIRSDVTADATVRADLAIRFGLILNEIILNAMEHATSASRDCTIVVTLRSFGTELELVASDDGPGLGTVAPERIGLGIQLIESMASRLGGSAVLNGESGTVWTVRVPLDRNESAWE